MPCVVRGWGLDLALPTSTLRDKIGRSIPTLEQLRRNPIMSTIRTTLTFALVAMASSFPAFAQVAGPAQVPGLAAPTANEPITEAEKLVDAAIVKVKAIKTVTADILQKVAMLGQNFELVGQYLKAGEYQVSMKLTLTGLADAKGTMLSVCDGKTLWNYEQVLKSQSYRKLDIAPILEKLGSADIDPVFRDKVMASLGFSGPDALLVGLRKAVKFETKEASTLGDKPVWILGGTWRDRDGLVGPNNQPLGPTISLPPYIPTIVRLTIGQDDGWPYEVVMEGKARSVMEDTQRRGPDGRLQGKQTAGPTVQPSKIIIIYSNVKLNAEIKPESFAFQPPQDAPVQDQTQELVTGIDGAIQMELNRKKQQAAAESQAGLGNTIPIPKASDAAPLIPTAPTPLPDAPK